MLIPSGPRAIRLTPLLVLVLVCAWPLVNFANVNRDKAFSVPVLLAFFAVSVVALTAAYGLSCRVFPRVPRGSLALALGTGHALFFGYATGLRRSGHLVAAADGVFPLTVIGILVLMAWLGSKRVAVTAFAAGLAVAVALPAASLAAFAYRQRISEAQPLSSTASTQPPETARLRPNVYFVIADGYGRTDTLRKFLHFDNSPFMDDLEAAGFFVAKHARANYPTTFLALSTALNMDYMATEATPRFADRSAFNPILLGDNAVVEMFKGLGYSFVQAGSGMWQETNCHGFEDICIEDETFGAGRLFRLGFGETEMALMKLTPVFDRYVALARARGVFDAAITDFSRLGVALRHVKSESPILVVAHSYPPHAPFVYRADCSIVDPVIHDYASMRDHRTDTVARERYRRSYAESTECVSRQMVAFAREIAARDPGAIVIIQSDHGTDMTVDWSGRTPLDAWSYNAVEERFGIVNAIRAPEACRQWLYDSMSPVNTFRFVRGCLQGTAPEYLPDRMFAASYEHHPEFGLVKAYRNPAGRRVADKQARDSTPAGSAIF